MEKPVRVLSAKQVQAIYLLAQGSTVIQIAKRLKLRRETLSRWKRKAHFAQELERVTQEVRSAFDVRLTHLADQAITSLHNELHSGYGDPKRLQTALNILKTLGLAKPLSEDTPADSHIDN